jgi:hypothetical protein
VEGELGAGLRAARDRRRRASSKGYTEIIPGWDQEIRRGLDEMEMFICLESVDFLTSPYIRDVELSKAIERHESGQIEIVPVVLYQMDLRRYHPFLFARNPLPEFGKSWRDIEREAGDWRDALFPIGNGLTKAIEKARASGAVCVIPFGRVAVTSNFRRERGNGHCSCFPGTLSAYRSSCGPGQVLVAFLEVSSPVSHNALRQSKN